MSSLLQTLAGQLDENTIKQISQQLGADDQTTQQAINTALPMLVGALGRNAESPEQAEALANALHRNHDGSILEDVPGKLAQTQTKQEGEAILGHVLGNKRGNVELGVAKASGLDTGSTGQLMSMLAPLVMGTLGQMQDKQNMGVEDIAGLLQSERKTSDSALSGMSQLLDMDGDGDVTDDVLNIGSKLLGGFFGSKG